MKVSIHRHRFRRNAINGVVFASFIYLWAFNFVPDSVRIGFAGILAVAYFLTPLLEILSRRNALGRLAVISTLVITFGWLFGYAYDATVVPLDAAVRFLVPFMLWGMVIPATKYISPELIERCAFATVLFGVSVALTHPMISYAGIARIAPFTGGSDGIHPSSYVMLICLVTLLPRTLAGSPYRLAHAVACAAAFVLLLGYVKRTSFLMLFLFLAGWVVIWIRRRGGPNLLVLCIAAVAVVGIFVGWGVIRLDFMPSVDDLSEFGSGRLPAWADRMSDIASRGLLPLLVGSGPGTDLDVIGGWWWAPKTSHSDFIHVAFEAGLIGLMAFLCCIGVALKVLPRSATPMLLMLVASSGMSNGLFFRPQVFPIFLFGLVVYSVSRPSRSGSEVQDLDLKIARPSSHV